MLYRETGQFKTNYSDDQAVFPILQDRIGIGILLAFLFIVVPLTFNDFWLGGIMIPTLVFALAAVGLNLLTGYAGQLSLGTGGFMGVGAYACYKLTTIFPDVNIIIHIMLSGFFAAGVGFIFGLPSLRIKGFYLAVATLASQFFLAWEEAYMQHEIGRLPERNWQSIQKYYRNGFSHTAVQRAWAVRKDLLDPEFVRYVDSQPIGKYSTQ